MRCIGSLKSGDSIMLSCLSPRRPCCGPNAATSLMSSQAARASSECVRSAVTEAGCASSATRLPRAARASAGSAIRRSMPNFMVLRCQILRRQSNRHGGNPACPADAPGPIGLAAVRLLDHRRKAETPRPRRRPDSARSSSSVACRLKRSGLIRASCAVRRLVARACRFDNRRIRRPPTASTARS